MISDGPAAQEPGGEKMPDPSAAPDPDCPLTLVYGPSVALRRRVVEALVAAVLPEAEREWGLVVLDAGEVGPEGVVAQLGAGSLLATDRVVVVRNVDKLAAGAQGVLARGLRNVSPGTRVVLEAATGQDARRKGPPVAAELRKVLEAGGRTVEATMGEDRDLPGWVAEEAAAQGKRMSPAVARAFVEIVSGHPDALFGELDKLVTYVGEEQRDIALEDVRAIVCGERESSVFDLVDAIGQRDATRALSVLPDLLPASGAQGAAMPLLAMIARQLRLIWQAKALSAARLSLEDARGLPPEWEDKLPGEHNFFASTSGRRFLVRKYGEQARNFTDAQLVRAMLRVYETDLALKGQSKERLDDRLALETLIVALCGVR